MDRLACVSILYVCTAVLSISTAPSLAQGIGDTAGVKARNPRLRSELLAMEKIDQGVRQEWIDRMSSHTVDASLVARMDSIDASNTARMREIVRKYCWPGRRLAGDDGADAAFLLVQHADHDTAFQILCLPLLRKAYEAGDASGQSLALLTDRVLVHQGRPQLYGSQMVIRGDSLLVDPIADSLHVDARRAKLGLPPMSDYLKMVREMYHLRDR